MNSYDRLFWPAQPLFLVLTGDLDRLPMAPQGVAPSPASPHRP